MIDKKYYVTTPIYYVTARPHLGTLYSTIIADVIARWQRLHAKKVMFLTGTDEHGQKIAHAAEKAGMDPQAFVNQFAIDYKRTWHRYHIEYTRFIRTTDSDHVAAVQMWIKQLMNTGDIYKGAYQGWYCTPCESFVARGEDVFKDALPCPDCDRSTVWLSEETYFFRLSDYQDKLLEFYRSHPDFIAPRERYAEVIRFVESGLRDLSISRSTITWGVPFPGDERHVTYVWADALNNYITAIGYGDPAREKELHTWWPADVQVMGKDIVRFHAVYWPAFLMAIRLALPKRLLVHGWIRVGREKMSKSKGNVVDPLFLEETFGPEVVRYYLMRKMAITQDSPFSLHDLQQTNNAELANDLGNLLNRVVKLAHKYGYAIIQPPHMWDEASMELRSQAWDTVETMQTYMDSFEIHMALGVLWKYIHRVNAHLHEQEPWKQIKTNPERFVQTISAVCHALRTIALLAWPVLPKKMELLLATIGQQVPQEHSSIEDLELAHWGKTFTLHESEPLFRKIEMEETETTVQGAKDQKSALQEAYITIDDLAKVDLKVGMITACERLEGSKKLLTLTVDLGEAQSRIILSGIAQYYEPEALVGKQGVFVTNLKPRKMAGVLSQGMMLMGKDEGGTFHIISPGAVLPAGTRLK